MSTSVSGTFTTRAIGARSAETRSRNRSTHAVRALVGGCRSTCWKTPPQSRNSDACSML
jgi:hypothetical protein